MARQGAAVVVNDFGGEVDGTGSSTTPAEQVVDEVRSAGGRAVPSFHNVAKWDQAEELVRLAVDSFGTLDVVVNNAGILRDRSLANVTEAEWDAVIAVHLKGHAAMTAHAMSYWRKQSKEGQTVKAALVHTTSVAGFAGNFGQAAYAAAKLGILGLSRVADIEGEKYGVRSNAISPSAHSRLEPSLTPRENEPFDMFAPENVSPLVAWLAEENCPARSQIFQIYGNRLLVIAGASVAASLVTGGRWTAEQLDAALTMDRFVTPPRIADFVEGL
jgi:NAD(P)-dependent dehydrogenase (short-subunit alcohol dehydrogenase family)